MTPETVNIEGNSGSFMGNFQVKNIGDEAVNVSMNMDSQLTGPGGKTIDIEGLELTPSEIQPGNIGMGQFSVNLNDAIVGEYTGIIKAQVEDGSDADFLVVKVNVTYNGQDFNVIAPPQNSTQSGEKVYQIIRIESNANKNIPLHIAKEGYEGMDFSVDRTGLHNLPAFGSMKIISSVDVPAERAPGIYTGKVNMTSDEKNSTASLGISVQTTYKANVNDVTISDVDPGEAKSAGFKIQNKGNINLTNLRLSNFTIQDDDGDTINVTFNPGENINVPVGSSKSVKAKADVSDKMDFGEYSEEAVLEGTGISETFNVNVETNSILKVTDVDFDPSDVKPGEDFDVEVTVENIADDIDLEDVELEIFIMDGRNILEDEDDDEVEDDADIGDLDEGEDEDVTFTFTMPRNTEDGDSFGVKVIARGENTDDSSEKFEDIYEEDDMIDVEQEDHEVEIYRTRLDSGTLSCTRTTYVEIGLRNIGKDDEEVILSISNDQLGMREQDNFDMSADYDDSDNEVERSYMLDFSAAPTGTYTLLIMAENDDGDRLDTTSKTVNVKECGSSTGGTSPDDGSGGDTGDEGAGSDGGTQEEEESEVVYSGDSEDTEGATTPSVTAASVKKSEESATNPLLIAALALGNLILLILVVTAVVYLAKPGKKGKAEA
ncbi:MAG: hypothetical protein R6U32_00135 [Candidatus Woesearchaeota archaeon]